MTPEEVELKRLLTNAKAEAKDMTFNFRQANKGYVINDRKLLELQDELLETEEQRAWMEWYVWELKKTA